MTEETDDEIRERAMTVAHERLWRSVATLAMLDLTCSFRRCRRHGGCQGTMWRSNYQAADVAEHQAMGFSGWAVCALPTCIVTRDEATFAGLQKRKDELRALRAEQPRLLLPHFICMDESGDEKSTFSGHRRGRAARFRALYFALTKAAGMQRNGAG